MSVFASLALFVYLLQKNVPDVVSIFSLTKQLWADNHTLDVVEVTQQLMEYSNWKAACALCDDDVLFPITPLKNQINSNRPEGPSMPGRSLCRRETSLQIVPAISMVRSFAPVSC